MKFDGSIRSNALSKGHHHPLIKSYAALEDPLVMKNVHPSPERRAPRGTILRRVGTIELVGPQHGAHEENFVKIREKLLLTKMRSANEGKRVWLG